MNQNVSIFLNSGAKGALDSFDFEKLEKALSAMDWVYYGDSKPPSSEFLKEIAKKVLAKASASTCIQASCGGFEAERLGNEYFLKFTLVESSALGDED